MIKEIYDFLKSSKIDERILKEENLLKNLEYLKKHILMKNCIFEYPIRYKIKIRNKLYEVDGRADIVCFEGNYVRVIELKNVKNIKILNYIDYLYQVILYAYYFYLKNKVVDIYLVFLKFPYLIVNVDYIILKSMYFSKEEKMEEILSKKGGSIR